MGPSNFYTILIPNRTFLVRFGGISGDFGRAMVRILARRSRAKIPMARPNEKNLVTPTPLFQSECFST